MTLKLPDTGAEVLADGRRMVPSAARNAEPILQALSEGRPVNATNTLAVGCYCPWASETP